MESMKINIPLLRALTIAINSIKYNPEIVSDDAELYEQSLIILLEELRLELDRRAN